MATYTYDPTMPAPSYIRPTLVDRSPMQRSALSAAVQTVERPIFWRWEMEWVLAGADLAEVVGFFSRVQKNDRIRMHAFHNVRRGTWSGVASVDGASQTGKTLNVSHSGGGPVTDWAKAGDHFWYLGTNGKGELKMVTADADSDGAGDATLEITPQINSSPADASAIDSSGDVYGQFILVTPPAPQYDARQETATGDYVATLNIVLEEDV